MQRLLSILSSLFLPPHSSFFNIFFLTLSYVLYIFSALSIVTKYSTYRSLKIFSPFSNLILLLSPSIYSTLLIIIHPCLVYAISSFHSRLSLFFTTACPSFWFTLTSHLSAFSYFLCPESSIFQYLIVLQRFAGRNGMEWLNVGSAPVNYGSTLGFETIHPSKKGHIIKHTLTLKKTQKALSICRSPSTILSFPIP